MKTARLARARGEETSSSLYDYRAAGSDGSVERGMLRAPSIERARVILIGRGLFPLTISARALDPIPVSVQRLSASDLSVGLRSLATLLESGLPLTRVLSAFDGVAPEGWRAALPIIGQYVREGKSLTTALADAPIDLSPLLIGIIRAGEGGSGHAAAVRRAADVAERNAARLAAVQAALAYPMVLGVAGILSMSFLIAVVLPRFATILADLGQSLPASTRLVLALGASARVLAMPAVLVSLMAFIGWRHWTSAPAGALRWSALLLEVPLVGSMRRSFATARACEAMSSLMASGVTIAPALVHGATASGDAAIAHRLIATRTAVIRGDALSSALDANDALTTTTVRLARAGEQTGRIADMLQHAARLEAERADVAMQRAIRMLEPALILVFGGAVALVALALLQAIYTIRPTG